MANRPCPSCSASMKPFMAGGVELDRCSFCRGLWFDGGELEKVLGKRIAPTLAGHQTSRRCATCAQPMDSAELGGVQVEVCQADRGVFLDDKELIALNDGKRVAVQQLQQLQAAPPRAEPKDEISSWLASLGV